MEINFDKNKDGLVPVIIQNYLTEQVLMLGYMNAEAYQKTLQEGKVTFFSRSKNRLWTKGETSGNFLELKETLLDCDQDTLLIKVKPNGPTCHTGSVSCFGNQAKKGFLYELQQVISDRIDHDVETSYTNQLYKRGINKVAQKVGEEAVEVVIEAKDDNEELFKNESADLLYHFLILLKAKGFTLEEIETVLRERHS
ncbi:bifunctional phosphoribosyl-AMP cyclohydrolase/phosphoribosyl-ATP diphosphatase HisIE [Elizabethkingia meningoseptica]|uniref:bifunctional phosphoribosyl-AMP cyclohydrolase/phosphoribosyl-ATP diphosphatase HisIE n=1 Tax=Elizabethkingia meningoseptica TaxID=238 RepID=UPI000999A0B6|nr:bifunctional phosphoribosyl-AMP cyclohydrolase/phosphoribosyl-ATP diphosphatase HisIE [Elizabethkingia meningoseptica]EJK5327829.1 bifunctional phosphoribosyl-AMP cyclohydrolase/phosphoribosyl-ATP diphosphatase HisIE [Elizabethkingia meningoseptica]MDE5466812.1 bifunctional phosphoribosyl-AMP cyclohydrolase/phosphoribosyl-ATP diphosphatase HisIE [Elizabethkingia meningoseptica]MDE5473958.1 bifunctional phosphoribosyl-AMP cyclohydrolase/phosphoribosyl-ATP diphosphatase HisIE [Elizabethkingia m